VEYINEDDGSYTDKIKSSDERKIIQFCAVKGGYKRNRESARHVENRIIEMTFSKITNLKGASARKRVPLPQDRPPYFWVIKFRWNTYLYNVHNLLRYVENEKS
jgi:hypothetical protein